MSPGKSVAKFPRDLTAEAVRRQRQAAAPGASVWVSASAGTGKTKVLIDRVLGLLLAGTEPQRILCITFTRAAASEMAGRIADKLGEWAIADEDDLERQLFELTGAKPDTADMGLARQLFADVLEVPGGMNIQTIHAFCQSLLRRFPLEADIAPHFSLMDERDAQEMLLDARAEMLSRAQNLDAEDGSKLARALAEVTNHIHETLFPDLLAEIARDRGRLGRLLDARGGIGGLIAEIHAVLGVDEDTTPDTIIAVAVGDNAIDQMGLRLATEALLAGSKTDKEKGAVIADWLADVEGRVEKFAGYQAAFLTTSGPAPKIRKTLITKPAAKDAPGVLEILTAEAERLMAVDKARRAATVAAASAGLIHIADAMLDTYRRHKERRALLDYDDLIFETDRLLHLSGVAPWVLFKLDGGIDHILIDEAQDTSPAQWRVIGALAEEFFAGAGAHDGIRTVFAVGDAKQSIYSFQGADPDSFVRMRDHFAARVQDAEADWDAVDLDISFRSTPPVLSAVDAVFKNTEARDGVSFDGAEISHLANRAGDGGLVELWPAVMPRDSDPPDAWKPPVERFGGDGPPVRLARLIAGRIAAMVGNETLESQGRPIAPGDIMVLVRRRTDFIDELVRALKEADIDVAGVDRMVLTEQLAVMDLIALGRFLLLPEDDLTLAVILKGPLVGLDEEQLFDLAHRRKGGLWAELVRRRGDDPAYGAAHGLLSELLAEADYMPPFELFSEVLGPRRGRERLLARLGPDALDPIAEFIALAQVFERGHAPSLEGFLHWLEAGEVEIKRDLDAGPGTAVRVMTVHGAKGLQAPIVFLPDTLQVPRGSAGLFWPAAADGSDRAVLWPPRRALYEDVSEAESKRVTAEREREYRRLLYVAMTRAADRLYVCGWETKHKPPENCWYNLIAAGLKGLAEEIDDPFLKASSDIHETKILRLTSPQTAAVADQDAGAIPDALEGLPAWAGCPPDPEPPRPEPLAPSRPADEEPAVLSPLGPDQGMRFQRGRLIHALLQTLPDLAPAQRRPAAEAFLARPVHGLDAAEQATVAGEVLAILEDPQFAELFGPASRAEVAIVGDVGGHIISGQIDRLVIAAESITIIDYKSNRPPPERPEDVAQIYLRQLAAYRAAIREIYPRLPVRCVLLWTDGPTLMELADAALDAHAP